MPPRFYYAGVGSRETPPKTLQLMRRIAGGLEKIGGVLRSGGAKGADQAFESGVRDAQNKEIFRPAEGTLRRDRYGVYHGALDSAVAAARLAHPYFARMRPERFSYQAHARNAHQVLGPECTDPVQFLVCYTPDGAEIELECVSPEVTGGTRTAVVIADHHGVPVFNLARPDALARLQHFVATKELLPRQAWQMDAAVSLFADSFSKGPTYSQAPGEF